MTEWDRAGDGGSGAPRKASKASAAGSKRVPT